MLHTPPFSSFSICRSNTWQFCCSVLRRRVDPQIETNISEKNNFSNFRPEDGYLPPSLHGVTNQNIIKLMESRTSNLIPKYLVRIQIIMKLLILTGIYLELTFERLLTFLDTFHSVSNYCPVRRNKDVQSAAHSHRQNASLCTIQITNKQAYVYCFLKNKVFDT
jgi:hypothetical protein